MNGRKKKEINLLIFDINIIVQKPIFSNFVYILLLQTL